MLGQLVADVTHLQGRDRQALALDPADDLADQAPLDAVGLDQHQGPLSHGRQRTCGALPSNSRDAVGRRGQLLFSCPNFVRRNQSGGVC